MLVDFAHQVGGHVSPRRPRTAHLGAKDTPRAVQEAPKKRLKLPKNA